MVAHYLSPSVSGTPATPVSLALADPAGRAAAVASPMAPAVWMQSFGDWGQQDGNGNATLFDHSTYGMMIGADAMIGERWRAGLALAYSRSQYDRSDPFDDYGTANDYTAAFYGGRRFGAWALRLGASYGRHDIGTDRQIAFTGFNDRDKANYNAQTAQGFGELGYDLKLETVAVEPFANFAYTSAQVPGFTEHGGAAALQVQSGNSRLGTSTLGVRISKLLSYPDAGGPVFQGMMGWQHNAGDVTPQDNVSFVSGGGASFGIDGTPMATDALVLDTGLDFAIGERLSLGVAFTGQFSGATQDQALRGIIRFRL